MAKYTKIKDSHDSHKSHDRVSKDSTATRILLIIRALCNGADLDLLSLKDFDFNISKRTFQRDIKKIKDFFIENIAYIPAPQAFNGGGGDRYLDSNKSSLQVSNNSPSLAERKSPKFSPSLAEGETGGGYKNAKDSHKSTTDSTLNHCDSYNLVSLNLDCHESSLFKVADSRNDKSLNQSLTHYIQKFATISGINALYPKLDSYFIAELFDDNFNQIYDISQISFEKTNPTLFSQISEAILNHQVLVFAYKGKERVIKPYKLAHIQGIWYLIADENGILKNFALNKMQSVRFTNKRFYPKANFIAQINDSHNLWHSQRTKSAVIRIDIKAKYYFLRKSLPPNINLIGYDESKILIRFTYAFDDEIFNFLKLWIPYARIDKPKDLQKKFNQKLKDYINATNTDAGSC